MTFAAGWTSSGRGVQHLAGLELAAGLLAGVGKHLPDGLPEPRGAVADRQHSSPHPAARPGAGSCCAGFDYFDVQVPFVQTPVRKVTGSARPRRHAERSRSRRAMAAPFTS